MTETLAITKPYTKTSHNWPIPQFQHYMCAHLCYKMVHCGIFIRCIVGFVRYCNASSSKLTTQTLIYWWFNTYTSFYLSIWMWYYLQLDDAICYFARHFVKKIWAPSILYVWQSSKPWCTIEICANILHVKSTSLSCQLSHLSDYTVIYVIYIYVHMIGCLLTPLIMFSYR